MVQQFLGGNVVDGDESREKTRVQDGKYLHFKHCGRPKAFSTPHWIAIIEHQRGRYHRIIGTKIVAKLANDGTSHYRLQYTEIGGTDGEETG